MRGEISNGHGSEPVFQINSKSKRGEAINLSLKDISPLFSLRLSKAAQELGISTTSLKKACRHVGLHRWPGRKVRGLESTIDGLEHTTRDQGADSGSLKEVSMRCEIPKLQLELHELCHGTPAQITEKMNSPIIAKIYKRLYYVNGWRSEYHNPGRKDINAGDQPNLTSGLAPPFARDNSTGVDPAAKAKKQPEQKQKLVPSTVEDPLANQPTPNADQESARPSPRKYIRPSPRRILWSSSRLGSRGTEMKVSDLEGLLPEVRDILIVEESEVCQSVMQAQSGNSMSPKLEIGEAGTRDGKVVEEVGTTVGELSRKCPKPMLLCEKCGKCGKWILP